MLFCVPADNWWCFVDGSVFTRMVDMYKSIVVFMLTGGKTLLVPVFYENYFLATLRLLEKLHKVFTKITCYSCKQAIPQSCLFFLHCIFFFNDFFLYWLIHIKYLYTSTDTEILPCVISEDNIHLWTVKTGLYIWVVLEMGPDACIGVHPTISFMY